MARPYRLQAEGCLYHITSRGDDRKKIFLSEADFRKFLEYLKTAKEKFKFYLYAYCLMGNHYHLLIETTQANLSKIMQYLNTSYTIYYNIKRKRSGHLFQGRFKSILVEADSYFTELTRYIHLNPVKVRLADNPEKYRWSSYNAYLHNKADDFIDKGRIKELLPMNPSQYRNFVLEGVKETPDIFRNVYAGFILGRVKFIKDKLNQLQRDVDSKNFAHKRAVKNIIDPHEIINAVAAHFKLNPDQICKSNKRPMTAKKIALYLLRRKTGLTNAQIGQLFDMKFAAVSKAALSFERQMAGDRGLIKAINQISSKIEV
jgi:REP element-mobilizing transposase RayT